MKGGNKNNDISMKPQPAWCYWRIKFKAGERRWTEKRSESTQSCVLGEAHRSGRLLGHKGTHLNNFKAKHGLYLLDL